jgi:hypothetical protein
MIVSHQQFNPQGYLEWEAQPPINTKSDCNMPFITKTAHHPVFVLCRRGLQPLAIQSVIKPD